MPEPRVFDQSSEGRTRMRSAGSPAEAPAVAGPSPEAIRAQLERIVASPGFAVPERLRSFLRYVVEEALAGRADRIKAYTIAVEVFERDDTFDPQVEPVVRIEAGRLRRGLEHYYLTAGRGDPLLIEVPKGGYVPHFTERTAPAEDVAPGGPAAPPAPSAPPQGGRRWPTLTVV